MNKTYKNKQLLKILIGVAWIDGIIQVEERNYLKYMSEYHGLSNDIELQYFLSELKPIKADQCYQWLEEYLGNNPTTEDYQELLESLSALIYSDGDIQIQEAQLLNKLQLFDPSQNYYQSNFAKLAKLLQQIFRNAIDKIV